MENRDMKVAVAAKGSVAIKETQEEEHAASGVAELAKAAAIALALALFIRTFMFQPFKIPSESMVQTLMVGDHLLVNKMVYLLWPPERGDIIVFRPPHEPDKDFVKRVIGLPGETISMRGDTIYINGKAIEEPYAIYERPHGRGSLPGFEAIKVPEGKLFMMGDNRNNSQDSRAWGVLDIGSIHGKAFIIHWSWNGNGLGVRFDRVGKLL